MRSGRGDGDKSGCPHALTGDKSCCPSPILGRARFAPGARLVCLVTLADYMLSQRRRSLLLSQSSNTSYHRVESCAA